MSLVELEVGSDVELADHFAFTLHETCGPVHYCQGEFWRYIGTHWKPFQTNELRRLLHKYDGTPLGRDNGKGGRVKLNKSRIDSVLHELSAMCDEPDFFEKQAQGINCVSGLIQFDPNGDPTLVPHSPDHRRRNCLPGRWPLSDHQKQAETSLLAMLLHGCFGEDEDAEQKIHLLQEIAGVVALGIGTKLMEPKAIVFKGETAANGKSQVLAALRGLLPPNAITTVSPLQFKDEKFLVNLIGKHLNTSDELSSAAAVQSDIFKQVITGEPLTARANYRDPVTFGSIALNLFATNELPSFRGGMDRGIQRRLLVLAFGRSIPAGERIPEIGVLIAQNEQDVLLDFAVEGAKRILKTRKFIEPPSSKVALRDWIFGSDPVRAYAEEVIGTASPADYCTYKTKDVYHDFRSWAEGEGYNSHTLPMINNLVQRLKAAVPGSESKRAQGARCITLPPIPTVSEVSADD